MQFVKAWVRSMAWMTAAELAAPAAAVGGRQPDPAAGAVHRTAARCVKRKRSDPGV